MLDVKLLCIGDGTVGKTKLVQRFLNADSTVGDQRTYALTIYKHIMDGQEEKPVTVDIWDVSGQNQFISLHPSYYYNAHGCILVFDINKKASYRNLKKWYADLREYRPQIPCLVAANKIDLNYAVTHKSFKFVSKYNLPLHFVSALDGTNVAKLFADAVQAATSYMKNPSDVCDIIMQELNSIKLSDEAEPT